MAYVPRIEAAGEFIHVGTRGNNKRPIYLDDADRRRFLLQLGTVARKYAWSIYAYCLMGNHYHLVLRLAERGLSRAMCELNTGYAAGFNLRYRRMNHVFGRRFWSEHIKTDSHLLQAVRYVLQNPVRAALCRSCEEWLWSSYRATSGQSSPDAFLAVAEVLHVVAPNAADPREIFRDYCGVLLPKRIK